MALTGIYPVSLTTKADYYLLMVIYPKEIYKPLFQDLMDTVTNWVNVGPLALGQIGQSDETHKIVSVPQTGGTPISYQYVLQQNSNAKLFRLGFTMNEVSDILNN